MGKICFFNTNLAWGGGENWHLNAALSLAGRGRQVVLACHPKGALFSKAPSDIPNLEVVPFEIGKLSFLNPFLRVRLARYFKKENVTSIIMNLPADLKTAGPAAKASGVRNIIYRRGSALPVRDSALNRHLYGKVITKLIVNSEATRRMVFANNKQLISPERVFLLPNGIDLDRFHAGLERAGAAHAGLLPLSKAGKEKPLVLGNAGRLNKQKGQHLFLQLGALLAKADCDFRLILAGEGEREGELKDLAGRLGIEDKVLFTGFLEDMSGFWNEIDVFVLTSLWEGFGYVLLEAMLAEKPILAFGVSNIPELIEEGKNGFLFPLPVEERGIAPAGEESEQFALKISDAEEPLQAMAKTVLALTHDESRRREMGRAGRAFAEGNYSQKACMDKLEGLLS